MLRELHVTLWSWVAELEYRLYPWKSSTPPAWAEEQYGADTSVVYDDHKFNNDSLHYDWLKVHDDKIGRLQEEMIWTQNEIHKLKKHAGI